VLALDVDGTLIRPRGGGKCCNTPDDWQFAFPAVPSRLAAFHAAGYKIVLLSNQKGVSKGHTTADIVQRRMERVVASLLLPVQVFFAPNDDFYRKPCPGMWFLLAARGNGGLAIDTAASLMVGDAAGRAADHSPGDLEFALNLGLPFTTPEAMFGAGATPVDRNPWTAARLAPPVRAEPAAGGKAKSKPGGSLSAQQLKVAFVPALHLPQPGTSIRVDGSAAPLDSRAPASTQVAASSPATSLSSIAAGSSGAAGPSALEIVLLVAPPGTGKSTLAATAFPRHVRVNQDTLHSYERCVKEALKVVAPAAHAAATAAKAGRPPIPTPVAPLPPDVRGVVIDATNYSAARRATWVAEAAKVKAPIRAVEWVVPTVHVCLHGNAMRYLSPLGTVDGPGDRRSVPEPLLRKMYNDMAPVDGPREGLEPVTRVRFVPGPFFDGTGSGGAGAAVPDGVLPEAEAFARVLAYSFMEPR
jgi:DNA 3'-phosphatase